MIDIEHWERILTRLHEPDTDVVVIHQRGKRRVFFMRNRTWEPKTFGMGHAGAHWVVIFKDGRQVKTNNLWSGEEVPGKLWGKFRPNAKLCQPLTLDDGSQVAWNSTEIEAGRSRIKLWDWRDQDACDHPHFDINGQCEACGATPDMRDPIDKKLDELDSPKWS